MFVLVAQKTLLLVTLIFSMVLFTFASLGQARSRYSTPASKKVSVQVSSVTGNINDPYTPPVEQNETEMFRLQPSSEFTRNLRPALTRALVQSDAFRVLKGKSAFQGEDDDEATPVADYTIEAQIEGVGFTTLDGKGKLDKVCGWLKVVKCPEGMRNALEATVMKGQAARFQVRINLIAWDARSREVVATQSFIGTTTSKGLKIENPGADLSAALLRSPAVAEAADGALQAGVLWLAQRLR